MIRVRNPPLLVLALLGGAATQAGFLGVAANRLVSGTGLALWRAVPASDAITLYGCIALLAALSVAPSNRIRRWMALAVAAFAAVFLVAASGQGAAVLTQGLPAAGRIGLGAGFWALLFVFCLSVVDALERLAAGVALGAVVALAVVAGVAVIAVAGGLDALSLAHEYRSHQAEFGRAFGGHVVLVAVTLVLAVCLGVPLGIAVHRHGAWRKPVFTLLNVVQTIPSVALFGLLIAPLAALGGSGIGIVPAVLALVLYALLPVVRNTVAGLDGVDPATLDAARGMGLAPRQILLGVELPLAAPVLLAGLRIVTVQTIGLAVVAALIGAGGLGDFVFQGLGQYAVDLVLLGALPAIFLALAADFSLRAAASSFRIGVAG